MLKIIKDSNIFNSIFVRFLLIFTLPLIITQIVSIYVFYYNHNKKTSVNIANNFLYDVLLIKDKFISKDFAFIDDFTSNSNIKFYYEDIDEYNYIFSKDRKSPNILLNKLYIIFDSLHFLKQALIKNDIKEFAFYKSPENDKIIILYIKYNKFILKYHIHEKYIKIRNSYIFISWFLGLSILMSVISILFLKNQIRSIKLIAKIAERFGRNDLNINYNIRPKGATEIKSLFISFIKMRKRLLKQINEKITILNSISHDLKTPLTRVIFKLDLLNKNDSKEIIDIKNDIFEMQNMINEYLNYSSFDKKINYKNNNIFFLIEEIKKYYLDLNKEIKINYINNSKINKKNINLFSNKNHIIRLFRNIIDNAFKYGKNANIDITIKDNKIIFSVYDNGPGVQSKELKNIFKEFYKIDKSRNLNNSFSTGLGLSICRKIVETHEGRIYAKNKNGLNIIIIFNISTN